MSLGETKEPRAFYSNSSIGALLSQASGFPRDPNLFLTGAVEKNRGAPQTNSGYRKNEGEESDGISRRFLPEGFAFFALVASFMSGFVTFLLFYFGEGIR